MTSYIFVAGVVLVPTICSFLIAGKKDSIRLGFLMLAAGICFLSILWQVDEVVPFVGAGDDEDYFKVSLRSFNSLNDWFDLGQFKATHEQAGYPLLLSWVHQLTGDSRYHRKAVNVFFFLMLAVVWFGIGRLIGGRHLGFVSASGVLMATPLWFYWIFLFKDMVIIFLQSLFILGLVQSLSHKSVLSGYSLVGFSTIITLPFRSKLALVNLLALAGGTLLRAGARRSLTTFAIKIALTGSLAVIVLVLGTNPKLLQRLGVAGEHRTLDSDSVRAEIEQRERSRSAQFTNVLMFPLLYLVGEVTAFNPRSWDNAEAPLVRAVCMVPWIYIGVPLFLRGAWIILRPQQMPHIASAPQASKLVPQKGPALPERGHLLVLLMFVVIYAGVAWASADTTRWRMPALPPMIAIAGVAWMALNVQKRLTILLGWGLCLSFALIAYYAVLR